MPVEMPRVFQELPANDVPVQTLVSMLASNRVAHAVLCVGPPSSQSDLVASALACALVCSQNGCTTCDNCLQAKRHVHPDIHEYWPGGTNGYLIEQAQEIIRDAAVMPLSAPHKVYVLHDADKLTASSANALLKTLEEAPSRVVFILTTSKRFNMLETIVSRCVVCNFAPLLPADVCAYLQNCARQTRADVDSLPAMAPRDADLPDAQLVQAYLASCGGSIVQCKQLMASKLLQQLRLACFDACATLAGADERASRSQAAADTPASRSQAATDTPASRSQAATDTPVSRSQAAADTRTTCSRADAWQAICCAQDVCSKIDQCVQEEQQRASSEIEATREFLSNKAVQKLELALKRQNVIYNLGRYMFCIDVLEALISNVLEYKLGAPHALTLHDQRALIERLASRISDKQGVHMLECLQTYRYRLTRNCIPSVCLKALFIELREDLYGSCSPC